MLWWALWRLPNKHTNHTNKRIKHTNTNRRTNVTQKFSPGQTWIKTAQSIKPSAFTPPSPRRILLWELLLNPTNRKWELLYANALVPDFQWILLLKWPQSPSATKLEKQEHTKSYLQIRVRRENWRNLCRTQNRQVRSPVLVQNLILFLFHGSCSSSNSMLGILDDFNTYCSETFEF